jgi:Na+/alanine symporter
MWISALLGMVTKYAEIVLSLKYREKDEKGAYHGGPMYYIKKGLGLGWLAAAFAFFAMIACIGTGNATQSNSISGVLDKTFGLAPWITGIVLCLLVGAVILGGVKRIASVNEKLVPFMAVFFILMSIVCLGVNITRIPAAFALIFREAFNFKAAFGGAMGYGIMRAMRYGVALATVFFALSTILGWAYYGEVSVAYLFGKHQSTAITVYRIIYVAFVLVGAVAEINTVWLILLDTGYPRYVRANLREHPRAWL